MMKRNISFMLILTIVLAFLTTGFTANSTDPFAAAGYTPVSEQVWASGVTAYSGQSGSYSVGMESAYGVYVDDTDEDYVGDYLNLEQKSFVQDGETNRYIDMSSPVSGAYLMEDVSVVGMAKIQDSFSMVNYKPGLGTDSNWVVNWLDYF